MFILPRDETLRHEMDKKNANLSPIKYTCVCEKDFTVEEGIIFHVIRDKQMSTVVLRPQLREFTRRYLTV